jgi:hypothetical protein
MTKGELYDKLKKLGYGARAKYINRVKESVEGEESWLLAELEFDQFLDELNKALSAETDPTRLAVIAARIQGVTQVKQRIFDQWSIREDEDV